MNRQIKFIDLGTMDYKEAWDFQQNLFDEMQAAYDRELSLD